jgi:hypothetical protein
LDTDTTIALGSYCEQLLVNHFFQFLSADFEQTAIAELLNTKPHEIKAREAIYARITAHREFLLSVKQFIDKKEQALQPEQDQSDDDPTVHEIYRKVD